MRFENLSFLALSTFLIVSCSSEDEIVSERADKKIGFSTYIENNTRAVGKTTFEDGDVIGLYACRTTGDYADTYTNNFMTNVAVTKGESGWTYSPISAWPTDENEHISFVAFYPRNSTTSSPGLTYAFTASTDLENQVDPLWCTVKDAKINDRNGTAINGSEADAAFEATSGSVPLKFKHMLSKVRIKIKLNSDYPGITAKLNSMTLAGISQSGTFKISNSLSSGSWSASSTKGNIALLQSSDEAKELNTDELLMGEFLAIPQSLTGSTNANISINYTHTLAEGGEKTISKTIYLGDSWVYNKIYNYVVNVSLDVNNITLSTEIANWDDEEKSPEIGAIDEAPEPVDLGLSVKWASCDYGTVSPYVGGPAFPFSSYNMTFNYTWGEKWSVPSKTQWSELFNNCEFTRTTINGVSGFLATANNGNTIFFPCVTYWTSDTYFHASGVNNYVTDTYFANVYVKATSGYSGKSEGTCRPLRLVFQ